MEPGKHLQTLEDLLKAVELSNDRDAAMLRATTAHISMCLDKPPTQIALCDLADFRPQFGSYLREKHLKGQFTKNTVRSYVNYLRILLKKAEEFGWSQFSPQVQEQWTKIWAAVSGDWGARHIVTDAVRRGISPADYTDVHLERWCEQLLRNGRHPGYVREKKSVFRRRIVRAHLEDQLPKLSLKIRKDYCVPRDQFPEKLRNQMAAVRSWKEAPYLKGRPCRYRSRKITVDLLERLIRQLHGYVHRFLGETASTLPELLTEHYVSRYVEWGLNERGISPRTLTDKLRLIPPLRWHPLFKGQEFAWVRALVSDLPYHTAHTNTVARERKKRHWREYSELARVPGQILARAEKATEPKKRARLVRDALLIKWFLVLAWRQRNVRECRLAPSAAGGNLFKEEIPPLSTMALPKSIPPVLRANPYAKFWQFSFNAEETKAGRPVRALLPRQLIGLLEEYIGRARPVLLGSKEDPGTLFLNNHGQPLSTETLRHHVVGITSRYVGRPVNPHLFRDIFAVAWLKDGRGIENLSTNLWHCDFGFTRRVYAGLFDESYGTQAVEEWLDSTALADKESES